jgi:hypothetical protein
MSTNGSCAVETFAELSGKLAHVYGEREREIYGRKRYIDRYVYLSALGASDVRAHNAAEYSVHYTLAVRRRACGIRSPSRRTINSCIH